MDSNEVVTSVILPGQNGESYQIEYVDAAHRTIKRPDKVEVRLELNGYGNVTKTSLPLASVSATTWGSDVLPNQEGKVTPESMTSASGRVIENVTNDYLQPEEVIYRASGTDTKEVKGVTTGTLLRKTTPHTRFPIAEITTVPSNGETATIKTPVVNGDLKSIISTMAWMLIRRSGRSHS